MGGVLAFVEGFQLFDNGCPQVAAGIHHRSIGSKGVAYCDEVVDACRHSILFVFILLCCLRFLFGFFSSGGGLLRRSLSRIVEFHTCRRHTLVVVAGSVSQESLYMIDRGCNLEFLYELHHVFKKAHLHIKHGVVIFYLPTDGTQTSHRLQTFKRFCFQGGRGRSS